MKLNLARLHSIENTLKAIENCNQAIEWYKDTTKAGPAYITVKDPSMQKATDIQLSRECLIELIESHRDWLIQNLEDRFEGFEYDPNAPWHGDKELS